MTAQETAKRNEKSQWLKVWQVDDTWFYVESEDGKIAYKCCISDQGDYCNCGDFAQRGKNDPHFKCKHLLAVMDSVPRNEVMEAQIMEKRRPRLDDRFIKQIDGKDFALYAGLLDLAHQKNLTSIEVDLLQFPTKENDNTAVCKAVAKTSTGGVFVDVGDANPNNCNSKVARHIIRMASTRAKARCLRDLTNIGMTALEELGDFSEVIGADAMDNRAPQPVKKDNVKKFSPKPAQAAQPVNGEGRKQVNDNAVPDRNKVEVAVQTDTPVLPPAEAPANKAAAGKTDKTPKAPAVSGQAAKSGNGNGNGKTKIPMMSEAQKSAIYNLSRRRGVSVEELEAMAQNSFSMPMENLTSADASTFIKTLQQAA